jgi:hypothetical protein
MLNAWVSVAALTVSLAAVGVILLDRGISLTALAWAAVMGLAALGMTVRSARHASHSAGPRQDGIVQVRKEDLQVKNSSTYWIGIVCLAAAAAALYGIFAGQGLALRGMAWVTLGLAAVTMAVVVRKSPRALTDVISDVDHEPKPVAVRSSSVGRGTP